MNRSVQKERSQDDWIFIPPSEPRSRLTGVSPRLHSRRLIQHQSARICPQRYVIIKQMTRSLCRNVIRSAIGGYPSSPETRNPRSQQIPISSHNSKHETTRSPRFFGSHFDRTNNKIYNSRLHRVQNDADVRDKFILSVWHQKQRANANFSSVDSHPGITSGSTSSNIINVSSSSSRRRCDVSSGTGVIAPSSLETDWMLLARVDEAAALRRGSLESPTLSTLRKLISPAIFPPCATQQREGRKEEKDVPGLPEPSIQKRRGRLRKRGKRGGTRLGRARLGIKGST